MINQKIYISTRVSHLQIDTHYNILYEKSFIIAIKFIVSITMLESAKGLVRASLIGPAMNHAFFLFQYFWGKFYYLIFP